MKNENIESLLIAYINNDLDAEKYSEIKQLIQEDDKIRSLYEELNKLDKLMQSVPELEAPDMIRQNFEKALSTEMLKMASGPKTRFLFFYQNQIWKVAAAFALIATGLFIGIWIAGNNRTENAELAKLREEIEMRRKTMFEALNNSGSASARIHAVNASEYINKADPEIIGVLIKTMNEDENTNVRLAAMRALGRFDTEEQVKQAFIESLETQKDPILQITLINLLVEMNDKRAKENLKKLIEKNETLETVKDEAYLAIFRLS